MILETIRNYISINRSLDVVIKNSGYKISYLYDQMGMNNNSFYIKRKNGTFSPSELIKLFSIIDLEKLEDKVLIEMSLEGESSGVISESEKRELLDAC